jgi:small ligand-binding sensory domain FIST
MMIKLAADPQVFGTGYSANPGLLEAIQEATDQALSLLPPVHSSQREAQIDLAIVSISSLYDGQASPSIVVPAVLSSANVYGKGVQHLVGCTAGGIISSTPQSAYPQKDGVNRECKPIETEGLPGVSVTLALLPGVYLKVCTVGYILLHVLFGLVV